MRLAPYVPHERYSAPTIGVGEFPERLRSGDLGGVRSRDGAYQVVDFEQLEPYLQEADALVALGEWQKAHDIYVSLFVPEMVRSLPDNPLCQLPTVGYALCLIKLGRAAEAMSVLQCLSGARLKPAECFVNLSLAYLHLNKPQEAERVAQAGRSVYKADKDIQWRLGKMEDAMVNALTATQVASWRPRTWKLLAEVYHALGHGQEATKALERAERVEQQRSELTG